jgi:CubicO group peptidase (beta-lactamase class C family)
MNIKLNEKVDDLIKKQISERKQIGVQVSAYQYGEKIIDTWAGTMGPNDPRSIQRDSLFCSWSTTKGVAATAFHILADKGLVKYDKPVVKYWPEFGKHGKDKLTVAQAVSHQAGIYKTPNLENIENITDWEKGLRYVENAVPAYEPGTKTGYHAITYGWIIGGIIQKATGRHIQEVIREEIAKPLGIENEMFVGIPDEIEERLTTLEVWDHTKFGIPEGSPFLDAMPHNCWDKFDLMQVRKACIPAGNGHFTAHALARMYGALANGGEIDGVRLMSPSRIEKMTRVMSHGMDLVIGLESRKGIGFFLGGSGMESYGPRESAFGHSGAGGSIGLADPEVGLSIAVTLNKMVFAMTPEENRTLEICNLIRTELGIN